MRPTWSVLLMLLPMVSSCVASSPDVPPHVRYGEETCASCHMLVSDERAAAAIRTRTGETKVFDDIGCLLNTLAAGQEPGARIWVHAYESGQWLKAEDSFFVFSPELMTPMGGGIAALKTEAAATRLADTMHGTVLRFGELQGRARN